MNKLGAVLGVAVVATLAGCKDPDYHRGSGPSVQNEVKPAGAEEIAPAPSTVTPAPVTPIAQPAYKSCMCPPGTRHTSPCLCGAPDCLCVVEVKPIKPVEPETTVYVVQPGDYLSKISKKYNVTIASIKRLNGLKSDTVRVGQKLKLPGKLEIGEQKAVVSAVVAAKPAAKAAAKKIATEYTGATKEYVVKNGDTLGSIAYGNGINIRQLKKLNSLSKDSIRVGQKLKIPAGKVEKPVAKAVVAAVVKETKAAPAAVNPAAAPVAAAPAAAPAAAVAPAAPAEEAAPAEAADSASTADSIPATIDYVVRDTDDITGVSIRFGVSAAEIRELNNLGENDQLEPGKILKLPAEAQQ